MSFYTRYEQFQMFRKENEIFVVLHKHAHTAIRDFYFIVNFKHCLLSNSAKKNYSSIIFNVFPLHVESFSVAQRRKMQTCI